MVMQSPCLVNASALSATVAILSEDSDGEWLPVAHVERIASVCPPDLANVRVNGQMIQNRDWRLADGLLFRLRTRVRFRVSSHSWPFLFKYRCLQMIFRPSRGLRLFRLHRYLGGWCSLSGVSRCFSLVAVHCLERRTIKQRLMR